METDTNVSENWPYSGVKLAIHNTVLPEDRLKNTPSLADGLSPELEVDLRIFGCELIQESGILLKLPEVAMASAQVLYQRFFYSKSFVRHFYEHYSMACIYLAAKIEESPRRLRDIINVFHHMRQLRENKSFTIVLLDQSYVNLKNQVIKAERRVLKELGFCVHGKHPHKLVIMYLRTLGMQMDRNMVQKSWNYMNDVHRTDMFVRHSPETIACACIFLAARILKIPLPKHRSWMDMLYVSEADVKEIALALLDLYVRPQPDLEKIENTLAELRKKQIEIREKELEIKKAALASMQLAGSGLEATNKPSPTNNDLISPLYDKSNISSNLKKSAPSHYSEFANNDLEKDKKSISFNKKTERDSRNSRYRRGERKRRSSSQSSERSSRRSRSTHSEGSSSSRSRDSKGSYRRRHDSRKKSKRRSRDRRDSASPHHKKRKHSYAGHRKNRRRSDDSPSRKDDRYHKNVSLSRNTLKSSNGYDYSKKEDLRDKLSSGRGIYRQSKPIR